MSAVLENISTELRITGRILQETVGGLKRTGWMNLIIIITMAAILSIFGTLCAVVMETELFVKNIGSGLRISVYTRSDTDAETVASVIKAMPQVKAIDIIPKERAWDEMKKNYQVPDIANPLPDTIHIQMTDQRFIEPMVERLKVMSGVEKVNFAQSVLNKLQQIAKITSGVGLIVSLFLGAMTLFIISNTIHLLIEARSREIEILRMMGVGNWYIRLPFLFQGASYGLVGATIAYIPLTVTEYYIKQLFAYFQFTTGDASHTVIFMVLIAIGIVVGGGGAAMSVHKFLKI